MSEKNSWFSTLGHWAHKFHVIPALVLASTLFIIEQHHYLNWIDAAMLQVSQRYSPVPGQNPEEGPKVLAISDELYEKAFNQASPLQRDKLAGILRQILEARPQVLAVDLDLSPAPVPDASQAELDELLLTAHQSFPDTRLLVITPFPAVSIPARQQKAAWMNRMCAEGKVGFALPTLLLQQGTVLKYESKPVLASLGGLAAGKGSGVCQMLVHGGDLEGLDLSGDPHASGHGIAMLSPINYRYFDNAQPVLLDQLLLPGGLGNTLAGKTVFLGGAYGQSDLHATPHGDVPGVLIHAAISFSEKNPVGVLPHAAGWLIDVLLGIGCGLMFSATWGYYFRAKADPVSADYAVFWLGLNLLLMLAGLLLVSLGAAWLIHRGWWLNPAPMILGMFLDTLLAKEPHASHGSHAAHEPGAGPNRLARGLILTKWLIVVGIIGWAVFLLLHH